MARIPEHKISARSREKARRFIFCVEPLNDAETQFKIRGKEYVGTITESDGVTFIDCTCAATKSCYHKPHYLDEYRQRQMFRSIKAGAVVKYSVRSANEDRADRVFTGIVERVAHLDKHTREFKMQGVSRPVKQWRIVRVVRRHYMVAAA